MNANTGYLDRSIRYAIATVVCVLYITGVIHGALAIGLGVFAAIMVLTAATGFCPIYKALGICTKKNNAQTS